MIVDERDPSLEAFCRRQRISRATYYNMRAKGEGPIEYRVGKLIRISEDAELAWIRSREAEQAVRVRASA